MPKFQKPIKPSIERGAIVYFHCFSRSLPEAKFFCKGIVARLPTCESPIYKIIPFSVCSLTLTHGLQVEVARSFLGFSMPCPQEHMFTTLTDWMNKAYPSNYWTNIEEGKRKSVMLLVRNRKD